MFHTTDPIIVDYNDQVAIAYVKDPKFHSKIKYINMRCKYLNNVIQRGSIHLNYIHTNEMVVDLLTMSIPYDMFKRHVHMLWLTKI